MLTLALAQTKSNPNPNPHRTALVTLTLTPNQVENNNGWTVLHAAVNADKLECVSGLLEHPRVKAVKAALLAFPAKSTARVALHIAAFKSIGGEMVALLLTKQ